MRRPQLPLPLLAAAWLAAAAVVVVRAEETAAPGSRHGVCELSTAPSTVSRLYELEAALADSQVESGDAELGVKGVDELLQDYAAALCTDATGASDRGPGGLAHCPLIDTQGLWGAPDSSELYSGSRTFRGRFQLPQERTVTLDSMRANDYMGSDGEVLRRFFAMYFARCFGSLPSWKVACERGGKHLWTGSCPVGAGP